MGYREAVSEISRGTQQRGVPRKSAQRKQNRDSGLRKLSTRIA